MTGKAMVKENIKSEAKKSPLTNSSAHFHNENMSHHLWLPLKI